MTVTAVLSSYTNDLAGTNVKEGAPGYDPATKKIWFPDNFAGAKAVNGWSTLSRTQTDRVIFDLASGASGRSYSSIVADVFAIIPEEGVVILAVPLGPPYREHVVVADLATGLIVADSPVVLPDEIWFVEDVSWQKVGSAYWIGVSSWNNTSNTFQFAPYVWTPGGSAFLDATGAAAVAVSAVGPLAPLSGTAFLYADDAAVWELEAATGVTTLKVTAPSTVAKLFVTLSHVFALLWTGQLLKYLKSDFSQVGSVNLPAGVVASHFDDNRYAGVSDLSSQTLALKDGNDLHIVTLDDMRDNVVVLLPSIPDTARFVNWQSDLATAFFSTTNFTYDVVVSGLPEIPSPPTQAFIDALAVIPTSMAWLVQVEREDGTILRFCDQARRFVDGSGNVWETGIDRFEVGNIDRFTNGDVSNTSFTLPIRNTSAPTDLEVFARLYDRARVKMYAVHIGEPEAGSVLEFVGWVADVSHAPERWVSFELRSVEFTSKRRLFSEITITCPATFGATDGLYRCGVDLGPLTDNFTITQVYPQGNKVDVTVSTARPDDFYTNGEMAFTSGSMAGVKVHVRSHSAGLSGDGGVVSYASTNAFGYPLISDGTGLGWAVNIAGTKLSSFDLVDKTEAEVSINLTGPSRVYTKVKTGPLDYVPALGYLVGVGVSGGVDHLVLIDPATGNIVADGPAGLRSTFYELAWQTGGGGHRFAVWMEEGGNQTVDPTFLYTGGASIARSGGGSVSTFQGGGGALCAGGDGTDRFFYAVRDVITRADVGSGGVSGVKELVPHIARMVKDGSDLVVLTVTGELQRYDTGTWAGVLLAQTGVITEADKTNGGLNLSQPYLGGRYPLMDGSTLRLYSFADGSQVSHDLGTVISQQDPVLYDGQSLLDVHYDTERRYLVGGAGSGEAVVSWWGLVPGLSPAVGDQGIIVGGCRKVPSACRRHGNFRRYQGAPHLDGLMQMLKTAQTEKKLTSSSTGETYNVRSV